MNPLYINGVPGTHLYNEVHINVIDDVIFKVYRYHTNEGHKDDIIHKYLYLIGGVSFSEAPLVYVCSGFVGDKLVSIGIAGVYDINTYKRTSQCYLGANGDRLLWIDNLISLKRGCGSAMLTILEKYLKQHVDICPRKNIYIFAYKHLDLFYTKNGYVKIQTLPYNIDKKPPFTYLDEYIWYCKPI